MDSREAWNRGVDLGSHQAVAINPLNPEEILAGSSFRGGMLIKSTDEGNSWRCALSSYNLVPALEERISVYRIRYSPSNPAIVYAVTGISENVISDFSRFRKGLGVFRSEDGGDSWRPVNHGLEDTTLNMFDLAVHPHNPDIVYVATLNEGIYASSDGGASWRSCSNGLKSLEVRSLAIDHTDPDTLYAGLGEGAGMFKSTDAGALWKEINKGVELMCHPWLFPVGGATASLSLNPVSAPDLLGSYTSMPWTSIRSIVIDPTNTNRVYAADAGTGVYLSTDFGETWSALNQGLQIRAVERLAISNDGSLLYAATRGAGVYRLTVDEHDQGSQRRPPRPRRLDR